MKKFLKLLSRISLIISSVCIVLMTAIISYQVIARYFFNNSPAWSERLALVLLGYLVFFGAAVGVHKMGKSFDIIANSAVAIAGLVMVIAGIELTTTLWEFDIPSLGLPRGLALLPIPISGVLIILFAMEQLYDELKAAPTKTQTTLEKAK